MGEVIISGSKMMSGAAGSISEAEEKRRFLSLETSGAFGLTFFSVRIN